MYSYACCDGYEGVDSPPIVLNGCDYWVVFSMFLCDGLL